MPCYDPPPKYEREAKKSAEEAVRILCDFMKNSIDDNFFIPSKRMFEWWKTHRLIDTKIAESKNNLVEAEAARKDIELIEAKLKELG